VAGAGVLLATGISLGRRVRGPESADRNRLENTAGLQNLDIWLRISGLFATSLCLRWVFLTVFGGPVASYTGPADPLVRKVTAAGSAGIWAIVALAAFGLAWCVARRSSGVRGNAM
jgi:hypothetical protein